MFKNTFIIEKHREYTNDVLVVDDIIISEYTPNGEDKIRDFVLRRIDIENIISLLKDTV